MCSVRPFARLALPFVAAVCFLGATWNVYEEGTGDAPTIQAAMDRSAAGDTVLVWPGTYHTPPPIWKKAGVHLLAQAGPDCHRDSLQR